MTPRPALTFHPAVDTRPALGTAPVLDTHLAPATRSALTWLAIGAGTLTALIAFPSAVAAETAPSLKPPTTPCFRLIAFPTKPPVTNGSDTNVPQAIPVPPDAFFALPPDDAAAHIN
ncbi:MAG TPA: hypothetical protein VM347_09855, partial [Nonomuraea sp.]|nr:hypothetical protein [Nonomuraea sp.]